MDTVDIFAIIAGVLGILSIIMEKGTECAATVWNRTADELDEDDFFEANTVPMTTAQESLLIVLAALIKKAVSSPLTLVRYVAQRSWRLTPEDRMVRLGMSLRSDILMAVHSMISGYPERALLLYADTFHERMSKAANSTDKPAEMID